MSTVIDGSAGVTTNTGAVYNGIQSATAVASTSGTSIDFTSLPSWIKRITVMFNGVSTSGSSNLLIQVGAGSVTSSGYNGTSLFSASTAVNTTSSSAGFPLATNTASDTHSGLLQICSFGSNIWLMSGWAKSSTTTTSSSMGDVALSGTLDRVRITTVNGTDTFDAGSINILYE